MLPKVLFRSNSGLQLAHFSSSSKVPLGFIGLGHMGSKMVANLQRDGYNLLIYDKNKATTRQVGDANSKGGSGIEVASSIEEIAEKCSTILSILPNDVIVDDVATVLLNKSKQENMLHISCSTISPTTSRDLAAKYNKKNKHFIASPVFARPDGLAKRQATWMIAGNEYGKNIATKILSTLGKPVDFGDDVGAANIVKLCGNFLIATSIESIAESMALAEKHGVDRIKVMELLSSTIFDCLIYKGYGQRISHRDHRPGGFSLELGLKDVSLVSQAAKEASVPMPFLSTLLDRYTSAKAKGRSDFDWSAIGLNVAEDAGIDVKKDIKRNKDDIKNNRTY